MSRYANLIPQLDEIEAFGFWLKHVKPGFSISEPAVERIPSGEQWPIFVLYQEGKSLGVYTSPMEALARIGDNELTRLYRAIVSNLKSEP